MFFVILLCAVSEILCYHTSDYVSHDTSYYVGQNYHLSDYRRQISEQKPPVFEGSKDSVHFVASPKAMAWINKTPDASVPETTTTLEIPDVSQAEYNSMKTPLPIATESSLAIFTTTRRLHNTKADVEYVPEQHDYARPGTMSKPVPQLGESYAPSLQWHVGIYTKTFTPYMQICGGSLVKTDVALSAAHCFWNDDVGALRPALFAVAAGKLLRPWDTLVEDFAQYSDVKDIKIPPRFHGSRTSFQDDIAIMMTDPLEFGLGVMPVCINFDLALDRSQLKSGAMGTVAGWGLTEPNGTPAQRLNFLELPYVDIQECIRTAEPSFLKYITSDKICAGDQKTGRALCRGDSGGGLVFKMAAVPYLRGIASTAPRDHNECNAYAVASFTHVRAHMAFLMDHVPDIAEGCEALYGETNKTESASELRLMRQGAQDAHDAHDAQDARDALNAQGAQSGGHTKVVMMNVTSGERSVVAMPMNHSVSMFVCNCYCKN